MNHISAKRIDGVEAASWIQTLTNGRQPKIPLRLYFHIPFCKKKCPYCHFYSIQDHEELKDSLLKALLSEINLYLPILKQHTIISCYFGGGTPYLFGSKRIRQILDSLRTHCQLKSCAEITLEANPEQVQVPELQALYDLGINRLSLGVQSFQPDDIQLLQRGHTYLSVQEAIESARKCGFDNISIDLIYDLPNQTQAMWLDNLKKAVELPITHMSLYNLTIEPNTPFWNIKDKLLEKMPGDIESAERFTATSAYLKKSDFIQYEISAFSKARKQSLHNIGYWIGDPYLGFGPSASGFYGLKRYMNVSNLKQYCDSMQHCKLPFNELDESSPEERLRELIAVGLRYFPGVDLIHLKEVTGEFITKETRHILKNLESLDLLSLTESTIQLTERGKVMYDTVASEII